MKSTNIIKNYREFGLIIGVSFPLIIGFILPYIFSHNLRYWTIWIGLIFIIFGVFLPSKLAFFYKNWFALGHFLGRFNSKIILGFIFITVLIPISLLMKIFGYDPLKTKKLNVKSHRVNNQNNIVDLTKIF